ncbi:SDR family NAD(P)-dependent oxidoreductase [Paracoccus nototheniae]|uniref:SDR family NAD(P)-dependent oxidoreductase n=1 Tax=Paracoccus nototheniae TaxID=2489002 RepID=A0ABW4E3V7_9RHOB|nr:SDR family oxidoreductase [Paracoccus nototheniae]
MLTSSSANWASAWSQGSRVLVTGGTGGIGGAIADAFHAAGAEVISTGATEQELEAARAERPAMEQRPLDVRDTAAVRSFVADLGSLDVVVNCAGIIRRGEELDADVFARVIDINLTGTMRVCEAARPLLAQSRGSIINIASMLSIFGGGLVPGYSASKGGISQLTKSLAIAYASDGIRVNAVAPGWIATPLTEALQNDPSRAQPILSRTPMARWGTPSDLQGIALFLASPHAAFMTGTVIPVDGGYSIM